MTAPTRPLLDDVTKQLAAVYARDSDPVAGLVSGLLAHIGLLDAHITVLDRHIDATESQLLERIRLATLGGPAPATTTTWANRTSQGGQL